MLKEESFAIRISSLPVLSRGTGRLVAPTTPVMHSHGLHLTGTKILMTISEQVPLIASVKHNCPTIPCHAALACQEPSHQARHTQHKWCPSDVGQENLLGG